MNIQIFGKNKCFDTKKAQRYFKERGIRFQSIDVAKFGMSKGELNSVKSAVGGIRELIDPKSKDYEKSYIAYLSTEDNMQDKLLQFPALFKTPIVRNGKQATVGYHPEIWEKWE